MAFAKALYVEIWIFLGEFLFFGKLGEQIIIVKMLADGITVYRCPFMGVIRVGLANLKN